MSKVEQTMTRFESVKALPRPLEFDAVKQRLSTLGDDVDHALARHAGKANRALKTLDEARRETLKTHKELEELETLYTNTLALEMVVPKERPALMAVANLRIDVGELYHACSSRLLALQEAIKTLKNSEPPVETKDLVNLQSLLKAELDKIGEMLKSIPLLGMTQKEYSSLPPDRQRSLRKPGRQKPPLEAEICRLKQTQHDWVVMVSMLSNGMIRTLEAAIEDVALSRRGRPPVSDVSKLDRKLTAMKKEVVAISKSPTKLAQIRIARKLKQIEELSEQIDNHDASLSGEALHQRNLEKLRAKHRDLVVAEVQATGQEQSDLLLATARNEYDQLIEIDAILKLNPDASLTVTPKVNPAKTMERFARLRNNGHLKETELIEVDQIEEALTGFGFSRNRY